jgi:predicted MFS family arabinose efflux permease
VAVHNSAIDTGVALGGYAAISIGWRQCYSGLGQFGIAYAFVLMVLLRDAPEESRAAGQAAPKSINILGAWRELSAPRGFWTLTLINGLLCVGSATISTWMPSFFGEIFHSGLGRAGASSISYLQIGYFVRGMLGGL